MTSTTRILPSVVRQQYEKIIADVHFGRSATLRAILASLLEAEEKGEVIKGAELAYRVYAGSKEHHQRALRSSLVRLRRMLELYYAGPGATDPVLIEVMRGSCRLAVRFRPVLNEMPMPRSGLRESVRCQHMGDDHKAVEYVLEQYRLSRSPSRSPRLVNVRDTHVRAETWPARYRPDVYDELRDEVTEFLRRYDTHATIVVGWNVDSDYVKTVCIAAEGREQSIQCYRLRKPGPVMNFILLGYDDGTSEVLFGWGQRELGAPGAVFKSDDVELVKEFSTFYEVLVRASDAIPLESILESPTEWTHDSNSDLRMLDPYRRVFHQYHLTQDQDGEPIWSYKVLDFRRRLAPGGRLVTRTHVLPRAGATPEEKQKHEYEYEASLDHGHLIVYARRADGTPDIAVQVFPQVGTHNFPWCGADILTSTWHNNPATGISIWSDTKLSCASEARDGEPISNPRIMRELEDVWERAAARFHFARLPSVEKKAVRIKERWDDSRFTELLRHVEPTTDPKGDLFIVTSFFINESSLRAETKRCLDRGVRIKILVMNPNNASLMHARFGLRIDRFTPERATQESRKQMEWLKALPGEMRNSKGGCNGSLVVRMSDIMPSGFVVHCRKWSVIGVMPARESYEEGPMIEADPETDLWASIDADWNAKWRKSKVPKKGVHY